MRLRPHIASTTSHATQVRAILMQSASLRCLAQDVPDAIAAAKAVNDREIFVIGGSEIYKISLPIATTLYLTEIHKAYDGDASFPAFDKTDWTETSRQTHPADDRHETSFDFVVYEQKG